MWHTPEGEKTFTGPYALLLAYGLGTMLENLHGGFEYDDDHDFGYRAFAVLTLEQKTWVLHRVAFGLLDKKTPIVPLVAYLEAAVATIFSELTDDIIVEIDMARDSSDDDKDWCFINRRAVLAAHEKEGRNEPPFLEDDEEPLTLECEDIEQWKTAVEFLEEAVLWDSDFDMDTTADMPPEQDAAIKQEMGIADDYYGAIPHDPKRPEAIKLLRETLKLCNRVIAREEKKLKKT